MFEEAVGQEGLDNLILGFIGSRGAATEDEVSQFYDKCVEAFLQVELLKLAASGKLLVNWSNEENNFTFRSKENPNA